MKRLLVLLALLLCASEAQAARVWSSGFELNSTTAGMEWTNVAGTPVISTTLPRSGTYGYEISSLVSATARYLMYQYVSAEGTGNYYFRFYVYFTTFPSAANRIWILNDSSATSTPTVYLTVDNSGVLRLYDEDGQITGTTTLSTGQWYCVEVHANTTPAAGSDVIEARVDGAAAFASASNRSIATTNDLLMMLMGGNLIAEAQTTGTWYFDDVAINDTTGSYQTSWPGAGFIIHLRPNAAGDSNDWTNDYTYVDEVTPDGGTTLVTSGTTGGNTSDYNIDAVPAGMNSYDVINCVQVGWRATASSNSNTGQFVQRVKAAASGTVTESSAINVNSTIYNTNQMANPRNYNLTSYTTPGTSNAWTPSDLGSAQIGVRLSTADATYMTNLTAIWLLVDYTTGTPPAGGIPWLGTRNEVIQ